MIENMGWIIAVVVAVIGWAIHAIKFGQSYGALDQRVKALEIAASDHRDVRDTMIRLETRMGAIEAVLGELKDGLVWMTKTAPMYGPPGPAPRSRAAK